MAVTIQLFDGEGDYECLYTPNSIVRAQNRARVTVVVGDTGRAKARPVSFHANSGATIICCTPSLAVYHIDYLHVLCEGFGSSIDLCNQFVVRNAIVQQSGFTSQVRNFTVTERIFVQCESPSGIESISVVPDTCERVDIGAVDTAAAAPPKGGAAAVVAFDPSKLQTRGRCVICAENCANCIFYPCKHICVCSMCYVINRCPVCRSDITSHSIVYIA